MKFLSVSVIKQQGGILMDVASLQSVYSQFQASTLPVQVGIQMLDKAKSLAESEGAQLVQMLQQSVQPHLGGNLDIKV
jgi:hypothetical protein